MLRALDQVMVHCSQLTKSFLEAVQDCCCCARVTLTSTLMLSCSQVHCVGG